MKHRVKDRAPALLAGLEKLLAINDLLETLNPTRSSNWRSSLRRFFNSA
jgi:hypothetical protein